MCAGFRNIVGAFFHLATFKMIKFFPRAFGADNLKNNQYKEIESTIVICLMRCDQCKTPPQNPRFFRALKIRATLQIAKIPQNLGGVLSELVEGLTLNSVV